MVAFNLLDLPAEIRGLIYEYVLTSPQAVTFRLDAVQRQAYTEAVQPALTRVNRQLRSESLPVYYECNDFVLHTEGPKADDAQRWLHCNALYLTDLRRLSLWVRFITLGAPLNYHSVAAQGALSISIFRPTKCSEWAVDDSWRWITVLRKPAALDRDAEFMIEKLRGMTSSISKNLATPDDYMNVMMDLKSKYMRAKMA